MTSLKRDNIELEPDPLSAKRLITITLLAVALVILPSQLTNKRIKVDLPFGTVETKRLDFQLGIPQLDKIVPETAPEPTQAPVVAEVVETPPPVAPEPVAPVVKPKPTATPAPAVSGTQEQWMAEAGIAESDWGYVKQLIGKENHLWCPTRWNGQKNCPDVVTESNPIKGASSAYGICQALPGRKMASAGADWQTNIVTQLRWCAMYSQARYGGWANSWAEWQRKSWW